MKNIEAWDMLHGNGCQAKSLTQVLNEMGFDKESYMVIQRNGPQLKVADGPNQEPNPNMSFGGMMQKDVNFAVVGGGKMQEISGKMNDFEAIDRQMQAYSNLNNGGECITGMTGSNNGVYTAMAYGGNEFIITRDPEIANQLEKQLGFAKGELPVPLSNGGMIVDYSQREAWRTAQNCSKINLAKRHSGSFAKPKVISSPFRDNSGQITPEYLARREKQLGRN